MIRAIKQGAHSTIVGAFVRALPCGRIVICVDGLYHTGWPVTEKE